MKALTSHVAIAAWAITISTVLAAGTFAGEKVKADIRSAYRVGVVGLDTSHTINFTKKLNNPSTSRMRGAQVVIALSKNSIDIEGSLSRVPDYTRQLQEMGIKIVDKFDDFVDEADAFLLETNDGRPRLEIAIPLLKTGKPVFVDKPVAASLADVIAIYTAARKFNAPVFSSSSLRYTKGARAILAGKVGNVSGCDTYSPCVLEKTHPDFYWYGIHGVEPLFTIMGAGCESVVRVHAPNQDLAVGKWKDGRIGTFRGVRKSKNGYAGGYGGTAFGSKGVTQIGGFSGYEPLLEEIVQFFKTKKAPVSPKETIEIYAFMSAADISKEKGGVPVKLADVIEQATEQAYDRLSEMGIEVNK